MSRRSKGMAVQQDSGTAQECLDAAAHCEQRAASAMDPAAKATFADAARGWDEFARCWRELQRQPAPGAVHLDCTRRAGVLAALTLFVWLRRHPEFAREYRSAKWFQCHCLVLLNQKKLAEGNPVESDKWRDSGRSIGGWDESGNGGLQ